MNIVNSYNYNKYNYYKAEKLYSNNLRLKLIKLHILILLNSVTPDS